MSEHHQFLCPRDMHLPPPDWRALEARLLEGGYVLEPRGDGIPYLYTEDSDWNSPQYWLGPAARPYLTDDTRATYDAHPKHFPLMLLAYDGPEPYVAVGENLSKPSLPGSDDLLEAMPPFDSHVYFIGAAYEDPAAQWHCAENGCDYRILELDWQYSLAMGFRMIRTEGLDEGSARGLAKLIGELAGQPMVCGHRHL